METSQKNTNCNSNKPIQYENIGRAQQCLICYCSLKTKQTNKICEECNKIINSISDEEEEYCGNDDFQFSI